jgi:DNA-binding NarL/FixJ family response regulator
MKITHFDDQICVTKALARSLYVLDHSLEISSFEESMDLLRHLRQESADVVILDLLTNDLLGLDIINQVKKICPQAYVVIYSVVSSTFIRQCVQEIGVHLFISKMNRPYKAATILLARYHDAVSEKS